MLRQGKLQMDDRSVENKLVEAIFNQNWSKKEPLQRAVQASVHVPLIGRCC